MQKGKLTMSKTIAIIESIIIIILVIGLFNYHYVNQSMATQISNLKIVNATLQDNVTALETKLQDTLPYLEAHGQQIKLTNQPYTHNPTWNELKTFLLKDDTVQLRYVEGEFTCGDFAMRLHDNAELAGIRAGVVAIEFQQGPGHAANVFYTTDKGIVYIDVTGCMYNIKWEQRPAVGYIKIGKGYGLIYLNAASSFSYEYYEDAVQLNHQFWASFPTYDADGIWTLENSAKYKDHLVNSLDFEKPYRIIKSFELYW